MFDSPRRCRANEVALVFFSSPHPSHLVFVSVYPSDVTVTPSRRRASSSAQPLLTSCPSPPIPRRLQVERRREASAGREYGEGGHLIRLHTINPPPTAPSTITTGTTAAPRSWPPCCPYLWPARPCTLPLPALSSPSSPLHRPPATSPCRRRLGVVGVQISRQRR